VATLYIETNFILSFASGQDADAGQVLELPAPHKLAIPAVCFMEALSALQRKISELNSYIGELDRWEKDLRRNNTSAIARSILQHNQQTKFRAGELINEMDARTAEGIERLCASAVVVPVETATVLDSLRRRHMRQQTDNLILHSVLADARSRVGPKALLTGNTRDFRDPKVAALLTSAGIVFHSTPAGALGWLSVATG
jgi:hypothetical protein